MRAVIDTNVWISALISRSGTAASVARAIGDRFVPVMCPELHRELTTVLGRRSLVEKYRLLPVELLALQRAITTFEESHADSDIQPISRDPKDDVFIALAVAAGVDFLVSGDRVLRDDPGVSRHLAAAGVRLVSVREFVTILEQSAEESAGAEG